MSLLPPQNMNEKLSWLRLIRSENVGPVTFYQLLRRYGNAEEALKAIPDLAKKAGSKKPITLCTLDNAQKEYELHQKSKIHLIARGEPEYPALLAQIDDAPPLLSVLGHPHLLSQKCIGIVGARNASLPGLRLAQIFATELGQEGFMITSGLARGIDTSTHKASLMSGTIAVLAGGVDNIYPPENATLYAQIKEQGAIISECPLGTNPQARHFPRRNRLISGLSLGIIVVEAAPKSGSLITADYALDQNRDVFAIPGSPLDPRAQGTNGLIKQGAHLVQRPQDVLDILTSMPQLHIREPEKEMWSFEHKAPQDYEIEAAITALKPLLSFTPIEIDDIIRSLDLHPSAILTALLALELSGRVVRHPGHKVSLSDEVLFDIA